MGEIGPSWWTFMGISLFRWPLTILVLVSLVGAPPLAPSGAASPPGPLEPTAIGTSVSEVLPVVTIPGLGGEDRSAAASTVATAVPRINVQPLDQDLEPADPLDGPIAGAADTGSDTDADRARASDRPQTNGDLYTVERSTADTGESALAVDGRAETAWEGNGERTSARFDLGTVRPVKTVAWLPTGGDSIVLQRSLLGGVWITIERYDDPEPGVWRTAFVDWPARYLRFRLVGDGDGDSAAGGIAELEVYGPADAEDTEDAEGAPARDRAERSRSAAERDTRARERTERVRAAQERRSAREGESDQPGADTSESDREPRAPRPSRERPPDSQSDADLAVDGGARVVEDCGDGSGECRIEIDVSAGSATCDERGGSGNRAVGRNASAGEGGTCVKDASGGTVDLGDINP